MHDNACEACPRCGIAMVSGFASAATPISFVAPEMLEHYVFVDEDLAKTGLRSLLPSKAEYFRSYLCRSCKLYLIDFSRALDRKEAEKVAHSSEMG